MISLLSCLNKMIGTTFGFDYLLINRCKDNCTKSYPLIHTNSRLIVQNFINKVFILHVDNLKSITENIITVEIKGSWDNWSQTYTIKKS